MEYEDWELADSELVELVSVAALGWAAEFAWQEVKRVEQELESVGVAVDLSRIKLLLVHLTCALHEKRWIS